VVLHLSFDKLIDDIEVMQDVDRQDKDKAPSGTMIITATTAYYSCVYRSNTEPPSPVSLDYSGGVKRGHQQKGGWARRTARRHF
jgi:hypothetical protein